MSLEINPEAVKASAQEWVTMAAGLSTAADNLSASSSSGFGDGVSADVATFLTTWSQYLSATSTTADEVSSELDAGATAYQDTDTNAQADFEKWLVES